MSSYDSTPDMLRAFSKSVKRSKYRAKRTPCGRPECGEHASKKEANRCALLQQLQKGHAIRGLVFQPHYDLIVNGMKVGTYIADFEYVELDGDRAVSVITEDCKGMKTAVYRLKKKLMKACHGIDVKET